MNIKISKSSLLTGNKKIIPRYFNWNAEQQALSWFSVA